MIRGIHEYASDVKVTGAISNISFEMPARKYINTNCMAYAIAAGLDSAIMDPCNTDMIERHLRLRSAVHEGQGRQKI